MTARTRIAPLRATELPALARSTARVWRRTFWRFVVLALPIGAIVLVGETFVDEAVGHGHAGVLLAAVVGFATVAELGADELYAALIERSVHPALENLPHPSVATSLRGVPLFSLIAASALVGFVVDLGLALFLLPGLVLLSRWALTGPIIIVERCGPLEAVRRSNQLVRGSTLLVAAIFAPILAVSEWLVAETDVFSARLGLGELAAHLASAALTVLLVPMFAIPVVLLHRRLTDTPTPGHPGEVPDRTVGT